MKKKKGVCVCVRTSSHSSLSLSHTTFRLCSSLYSYTLLPSIPKQQYEYLHGFFSHLLCTSRILFHLLKLFSSHYFFLLLSDTTRRKSLTRNGGVHSYISTKTLTYRHTFTPQHKQVFLYGSRRKIKGEKRKTHTHTQNGGRC